MRTYLLEKSRITSQLPGEQNYHVLYQVAANLPHVQRTEFSLESWCSYTYLNVTSATKIEWDQFPGDFSELEAAMAAIPTVRYRLLHFSMLHGLLSSFPTDYVDHAVVCQLIRAHRCLVTCILCGRLSPRYCT